MCASVWVGSEVGGTKRTRGEQGTCSEKEPPNVARASGRAVLLCCQQTHLRGRALYADRVGI